MYKYFESYQSALKFIKNSGLNVVPEKRGVWIYPAREVVWAVKV